MICTIGNGLRRSGDALLIAQVGSCGAHAGGDDQLACGLWKCANDGGLLRTGNHTIRAGVKGFARAI